MVDRATSVDQWSQVWSYVRSTVSNSLPWKLMLVEVSGVPYPSLLFEAAPGCSSDVWLHPRSPPPPGLHECPPPVGNQWRSSPPCPGRRGNHRHSDGSVRRRRLSRLRAQTRKWQEFIQLTKEQTELLLLWPDFLVLPSYIAEQNWKSGK